MVLVAEHDEFLELPRLTVQPVEPPDHDAITHPELDVAQKPLVSGPRFLRVECAEVVVHVDLGNAPPAPLRLFEAIRLLALDAEPLARRVVRNAGVNRRGLRRPAMHVNQYPPHSFVVSDASWAFTPGPASPLLSS